MNDSGVMSHDRVGRNKWDRKPQKEEDLTIPDSF